MREYEQGLPEPKLKQIDHGMVMFWRKDCVFVQLSEEKQVLDLVETQSYAHL